MEFLGFALFVAVVGFLVWKHKSKVRSGSGSFEQESPKQKQK